MKNIQENYIKIPLVDKWMIIFFYICIWYGFGRRVSVCFNFASFFVIFQQIKFVISFCFLLILFLVPQAWLLLLFLRLYAKIAFYSILLPTKHPSQKIKKKKTVKEKFITSTQRHLCDLWQNVKTCRPSDLYTSKLNCFSDLIDIFQYFVCMFISCCCFVLFSFILFLVY